MKKTVFLILPIMLYAFSPFETPELKSFDTSIYNTKNAKENVKASINPEITCRVVCDKKIYNEQKISDAINFYKKSRDYNNSY
jgi:hypothetical protein